MLFGSHDFYTSTTMRALSRARLFLEMIKFSHTVFALPFALLSATLAWHEKKSFDFWELIGLLLCMAFARSAAMAFNRLADRWYDARNPRTSSRHLPSGALSVGQVRVFTLLCSVAFVASTLIFSRSGNFWPFYFAVPVLLFLLLYSYSKRFTVFSHVWLGVSLMLAPIATWIAIRGMENLAQPLILGLAVLFWVTGFDMIYACQDVSFDRDSGLLSVPSRIGVPTALRIAALCHILMIGSLVWLWSVSPSLNVVFLCGIIAVAALLIFEHWLVQPTDLRRVNEAFFYVNGVISIGLLVVVWVQLSIR
jgi:4-hydroxybenzoate polyprenyltransferase